MLWKANNKIRMRWSLLASASTWLLLAGYIVFPATFTKWQKDNSLADKVNNDLERQALDKFR